MSNALAELEAFLNSKEADHGLNEKARVLVSWKDQCEKHTWLYRSFGDTQKSLFPFLAIVDIWNTW